MRYGIFSDVHSNLEALDSVIEEFRKENIDQYLCLGDVEECLKRLKRKSRV